MRIEEILRRKGRGVVTAPETWTLLDAARLMVEHGIGAVVVMNDGRLTGILTERDVLRTTATRPGELASLSVGAVMTPNVITARPTDELGDLMDVMTARKVRHLPVVEHDRLVGMVSIGDLVNACRLEAEAENLQLRQYVQGTG